MSRTISGKKRNTRKLVDHTKAVDRLARKVSISRAPSLIKFERAIEHSAQQVEYWSARKSELERDLELRLKKNPSWKRDRPKAADIEASKRHERNAIGHDAEKLELFEITQQLFQAILMDPDQAPRLIENLIPANGDAPPFLVKVVKVFSRKTRGPKAKRVPNLGEQILQLYRKGRSSGEIANKVWGDPSRKSAKKMDSLIRRLLKEETSAND